MSNTSLFQPFEFIGEWHIPGNSDLRIGGTLKLSPQNMAVLELVGSFGNRSKWDIILGNTSRGEYITLRKCLVIDRRYTPSSESDMLDSLSAKEVFVGTYFKEEQYINFRELYLYLTYLDEWVDVSGFEISCLYETDISLKYKQPDPIDLMQDDNFKLSIVFETWSSLPYGRGSKSQITQRALVKIQSFENEHIDKFYRVVSLIQNLLSLAATRPVYPLFVEGLQYYSKSPVPVRECCDPPIRIYYAIPGTPDKPNYIATSDFLFTLKDIRSRFSKLFLDWQNSFAKLQPIFQLYLGTLNNPHMYPQHRFLSLVQALESFHRTVVCTKDIPDQEYDARVGHILGSVPVIYKEWLKSKLGYVGNEPSLRRRLTELWDIASKVLAKITPERDKFITKVVNTRTYLTHHISSYKPNAADGRELEEVTLRLELLVEVFLLREIGFSIDEIEGLVDKNNKYKRQFESESMIP